MMLIPQITQYELTGKERILDKSRQVKVDMEAVGLMTTEIRPVRNQLSALVKWTVGN